MVGNGHVLVIGKQGRVGTKQLAHRRGVMDARIEIRVIADIGGQVQHAVLGRVYQALQMRLGSEVAQELGDPAAQGQTESAAQLEERIQGIAGGGRGRNRGVARQYAAGQQAAHVQDGVADGDAASPPSLCGRENAEGKILDGKLIVAVRRRHPAPEALVVSGVHHRPGLTKDFSNPSQQES